MPNKLKFNKVKSHVFPHGRYKIYWRKLNGGRGWCWSPYHRPKRMYISPKQNELRFLSSVLDESIHASAWNLDNDAVDEISDSIALFLWRIGFRLKK